MEKYGILRYHGKPPKSVFLGFFITGLSSLITSWPSKRFFKYFLLLNCMRSNHIHTLFTRYVDPSIPVDTARRVNHVMDNPSASDKAFRRLFPTVQQPRIKGQRRQQGFGVKKIGHRVYNHDFHDAIIRGWIEGGADGAKAGLLHLVGDMVRDTFVGSTGVKNANLGEALLEYFLSGKK